MTPCDVHTMGRVSVIDLAREERNQLCDLLEQVGPDKPTLCSGWTTRHLAAHLVVRESRPDAVLGILGGPLSAWTEKVQNDAASQPFEKLVRLVRNGPPIWSAFRLPWVDGQANVVEFFVHHEDVRRGSEGWGPRELNPKLSDLLWDRLRLGGRLLFKGAKGGVVLKRTNGHVEEHRAKGGDPCVTLEGTAGDLMLLAYGRSEVNVDVQGNPAAVAAFKQARFHVCEDQDRPA